MIKLKVIVYKKYFVTHFYQIKHCIHSSNSAVHTLLKIDYGYINLILIFKGPIYHREEKNTF